MSIWKRLTGGTAPSYEINVSKAELPALHAEMARLTKIQDDCKALRRTLARVIETRERQAPKGD